MLAKESARRNRKIERAGSCVEKMKRPPFEKNSTKHRNGILWSIAKTQTEYEEIERDASSGIGRFLTDEEAIQVIADETGFDKDKVIIRHSVSAYEVSNSGETRNTKQIPRRTHLCFQRLYVHPIRRKVRCMVGRV